MFMSIKTLFDRRKYLLTIFKARASTDHFFVCVSLDFHQLWRSVMSICLLTEVKQQWVMLVLGWVTV